MTSLGSQLRQERERKGLSLEQVSAQTRIRVSYLEAIEADRLETIPGGFFSRAFVRQYAAAVGLSEEQIARAMDVVSPPPEDSVHFEKFAAEYRPNTGRYAPPEHDEDTSEPDYLHEAAFLRERRLDRWWMAVAAVLILLSAGYLASRNQPGGFAELAGRVIPALRPVEQPRASAEPSPVPASSAGPADTSSSQPGSQPGAQPEPQPEPQPESSAGGSASVPTDTSPNASPNVAASLPTPAASKPPAVSEPAAALPSAPARVPESGVAASAASVQVTVAAAEKSWIRLAADGKRVFLGVLEAGESRTASGAANAVLLTGNAGALRVTFNGKPIGPVGPRGMVRTVVFSPQGFEIQTTPGQP